MRRVLLSLVAVTLVLPAFGQPAGASPERQQAGRYWHDAEYVRGRSAYEAKRDAEYQEARVLDIAGVRPGMTVAEVGAGNGYFTLKLARRVGPSGKVYANDVIEDALAELRDRAAQQGLSNIETTLATETDPRLPRGAFDLVFMVLVLHDLTRPVEVLEKAALSLKPGAKLIVVETEGGKQLKGTQLVLLTLQHFLEIIAPTAFEVERIDRSLPNPRSVVLILRPR